MAENINTSVIDESTENTVEQATTVQEQEKLYSAADVQSMIDKRVTQALQTQQKKFDKQLSLSKLDGDERAKAEKDSRIAELEEQLAQFQVEKNKSELKSVLSSRGLPAELADVIKITDDIEESQANIDKLDKLIKAAVTAEVEKRIAGSAPRGNGSAPAEITRETAKKMSLAELNKLMVEQPELYKKLFN